MTVPLGALVAVALSAPGGEGRLPEGDVRYRVELAGEHVGWARLAVRCGASSCAATWQSALAAPEPGGGEAVRRRIDVEVDRTGAARAMRFREGGRERAGRAGAGEVPASLAEALLAQAGDGERRCVFVRDEESGQRGDACARRDGSWLEGVVLGEPVRFRADRGELPVEVLLPAQGARFTADRAAALPRRPPRLFGAEVTAPAGGAPRRFCGREADPPPPAAPAALPREFPAGATCRERTARYLARVRAAGARGRSAVGVAFDGRTFVWHAWAEVWDGARWVPVDPSFEQAPAHGPRFTIARYDERAAAARAAAARAVLACWGRGRLEPE